VYEAIFAMHDAEDAVNFNTVHERLSAGPQELLAALVFDAVAASVNIDDGLAAIAALEREETEIARREMIARIRDAEREGRIAEAMELTRQMTSARPGLARPVPRRQAG
jgi:hypothetical protein